MGNSGKKLIIGILGGVGSGKSTVAAELAKSGCAVIDADKIAHELLERNDIKKEVVGCFGQSILDSAEKIDHRKLADIVFADGDKLTELNNIVHRLVLARVEQLIEQYNGQAEIRAIVLDMPLLVEVGWDKKCDKLVFVECRRQLRAARAKKNGVFNENQLKIRENFQISLDKKAKVADNRIDNNSGFSALAKQVTDIFTDIMNNG